MARKKHIDTRNLVVCKDFDEFAERVSQIDFKVEDIVGYITSITKCLYWLNVETVWGVIGFTFSSVSPSEPGEIPNPHENLEHLNADGTNIDSAQYPTVTKGWGVFGSTTIPFSIIPKLPDGYRITKFDHTFDNINSDYIELKLSDWSNLTKISNILPRGKSLNLDLRGANLSTDNNNDIMLWYGSNTSIHWDNTIYIRGNLKNCLLGTFYRNNEAWEQANHTVLLDDDNKGLNLPLSVIIDNQFYYTNKDKTFDIRDWLFDTPTVREAQIFLLAASKKYLINWKFVEKVKTGYRSKVGISLACAYVDKAESFTPTFVISDPIEQEITPAEVTIDGTDSSGNIDEYRLLNYEDTKHRYIYPDIGQQYASSFYLFKPFNYVGTINSINLWNPFCLVSNDDDWPVFNQNLLNKLVPHDDKHKQRGLMFYRSYFYISKGCPYTIDCANITHLEIAKDARFFIDLTQIEKVGNYYLFEFIKLANANNLITYSCGRNAYINNSRIGTGAASNFVFKVPQVSAIFFNEDGDYISSYYPRGVKVEVCCARNVNGKNVVDTLTVPHMKFMYVDASTYEGSVSISYKCGAKFITELESSNNPINCFEYDSRILQDTAFLKKSSIVCYFNTTREIHCPIIITAGVTKFFSIGRTNIHWENSPFIFIYNIGIEITNWKNQDITNILYQFRNYILPNIYENDTQSVWEIKLSKNIFDALTQTEKDYITDTLNYQLSYTTN